MSANVLRAGWRAVWRLALLGGLNASAWAAPQWIQECPPRIEHANWCHLLPSEGLMALRVPVPGDEDGLWGFVDVSGRMVIPPVYDRVMAFSQGLAAAHKDGKWGFIDPQGRWRIQPRHDDVTSFDSQGVAWAVQQGQLVRLSPQGDAQPWLRGAGQFDLDHRGMQEDSVIRVRVTPPPETWHLDTGAVMRWPAQVDQLGRPVAGTWPVSVRLPSGRTWWGLWSLEHGRWLASPLVLRSEAEPLFHADKVAVYREGSWRFVDLLGQPLGEARYETIEMDLPGLWVVSPASLTWEWLGADLNVLHHLDGRVNSPPHEKWGEAIVYDLHDQLLLAFPQGRLQVLQISGQSHRVLDGWIWLSPEEADGAPDLIGPDGRSTLSEAQRSALKGHRVEFLGEEGRSPRPAGAIRALLHPHDAAAAPGVITADWRVITQADWALVMPGASPLDPVVVQRTDGRFGAIDGMGRWTIQPDWLGLEAFHHGLTWGRHAQLEGGVRPVLIGSDGRRLALPAQAFASCSEWSGRWLRCLDGDGQPDRVSFLDPLTQKRIEAPNVDELREAQGEWLLARQEQRWGLLAPTGDWRVPPLAADPDAIEWLDEQVVRVAVHAQGQLTHQLWRIADGHALTPPRRGQSWRLAPDRYLVAGAQVGMEMLDGSGRLVWQSPWWGTDPHAEGGLAWIDAGQQLARLKPDGTLVPAPVHLQDDSDSTMEGDDDAADAMAVRGWKLRLSARCGQLIVQGPTGQQTWPKQPVRCRQP